MGSRSASISLNKRMDKTRNVAHNHGRVDEVERCDGIEQGRGSGPQIYDLL